MFPGRPWTLVFRTDPPGSSIPPTALVVTHPRAVPFSADDGTVVERFPATRTMRTAFDPRRTRPRPPPRPAIFTDPHASPDTMPPIRLRHPETEGGAGVRLM